MAAMMRRRLVWLALPLLAFAAPAPAQEPVPRGPASPLEDVHGTLAWLNAWVVALGTGTCRDPEREWKTERVQDALHRLNARYERLSGKIPLGDIILLEGDSCTGSELFDENYRVFRHEIYRVGRLLGALEHPPRPDSR